MISLKNLPWIFLLIGLAGLTGLIAWQGVGEIGAIIAKGGWAMLLLSLFFVPQVFLFTVAWRFLFPAGDAPTFTRAASDWDGSALIHGIAAESAWRRATFTRLKVSIA